MKNIWLLIIPIFLFVSCGDQNEPTIVYQDDTNVELSSAIKDTTMMVIADLPIQLDSTNYLIHPIGQIKLDSKKAKYISSSSIKGSREYGSGLQISYYSNSTITGSFNNLKFQHVDSTKLTALSQNIININTVTFLKQVSDHTQKQLLVYELNDKDTNRDGKLDNGDVTTLYISKINGSGFIKLTANNNELIDWQVIESQNKLYFRTIEDSNKDGAFDKIDVVHYKFVNLASDNLEITEYNPI